MNTLLKNRISWLWYAAKRPNRVKEGITAPAPTKGLNNKYTKLLLIGLLIQSSSWAQASLIFKNGFELTSKINDTGVTWGGEFPSGDNNGCSSATIMAPQDCHQGRDFNYNYDGDGHAGFSFTKLDFNGMPLADQGANYEETPWSCVRDNVTGLVWEVKTTADGIHKNTHNYQWGGITAVGYNHQGRLGEYYEPSWNELVNGSNNESLCGLTNWRVPKIYELTGISDYGYTSPAIDTSYFPNTINSFYWSASPENADMNHTKALIVVYSSGMDNDSTRSGYNFVRLVSSGVSQ